MRKGKRYSTKQIYHFATLGCPSESGDEQC